MFKHLRIDPIPGLKNLDCDYHSTHFATWGSAERHACDEHACLTELIIDLHNDLLRDLNHHFNLIQDEIREQNEKV